MAKKCKTEDWQANLEKLLSLQAQEVPIIQQFNSDRLHRAAAIDRIVCLVSTNLEVSDQNLHIIFAARELLDRFILENKDIPKKEMAKAAVICVSVVIGCRDETGE